MQGLSTAHDSLKKKLVRRRGRRRRLHAFRVFILMISAYYGEDVIYTRCSFLGLGAKGNDMKVARVAVT